MDDVDHSQSSRPADGNDPGVRAESRAGLTGLSLLQDGRDAFAARVTLIRSAEHTLDVQYYIWHADLSGSLMLDEVVAAAERGVAVRLLLDDNGIAGLDERLRVLCDHRNIAVKLYNPFKLRWPKALNWLFAFRRLNHRMHAKSLTADGRTTIVGGRNVGDEYFAAKSEGLFDDLDVLAVGPAVAEVSAAFERHWQSPRACKGENVLAAVPDKARQRLTRNCAELAASNAAERYRATIRTLPLLEQMREGSLDLIWAPVRVIAHWPPLARECDAATSLDALLPQGLGSAKGELVLISGYFVPTQAGCDDLARLARSGTAVRVLTNSYAATDVGLVHAGYAHRRRMLLASGVELFEMPAPDDKPKSGRKFIRPGSRRARQESGHSLHAKIYIVDQRQAYVGSANLDPRSVHLNTELGLIIDDTELAEAMSRAFSRTASSSYRLGLASDGGLRWTDERDDVPLPERVEPHTTIITRALVRLLCRLPIERHL